MLTLVAFYFHPSLDVARAQWAVARAGIKTAAGRPNPVLSALPGGRLNPVGTSPWEPLVSLDIPFETAGKRRYRMAQAGQLSEAARLNIAGAAWQVVSNLRLSLLEYAAARQRAGLLQPPLELQEQIVALLEQRFKLGAVARTELTLSRLALTKAQADYADAASQSALQLEIAKQYPDLHLNPGYMFDEGEHKWTLGLSVELPVLNRNQGPIAEAKAKREEVAARFVALQSRVIAQIDVALAARAATLDQVRRQAQLTRLAREQSAAAQALFNAGAADKLELASARLEEGASSLVFLEAQVKARQAVAQLEDALQRPLRPWPSLEEGRDPVRGPRPLQAHSDAKGNK